MDSKHRHELEQNDLLDFLTHFGAWWEKYGMMLMVAVLVVLAAIFAKRFMDNRAASAHEAAWSDLASATSPSAYQAVAKDYKDPSIAALASLRGADLLLQQASRPEPTPGSPAATQPAAPSRQQKLEEAARMYQEVVQVADAPAVYRLNAMLGLAAIAEDRGQWNQAQSHYEKIVSQADAYTTIRAQARARLAMLPRLQENVIFASEPASQPATQPDAPR